MRGANRANAPVAVVPCASDGAVTAPCPCRPPEPQASKRCLTNARKSGLSVNWRRRARPDPAAVTAIRGDCSQFGSWWWGLICRARPATRGVLGGAVQVRRRPVRARGRVCGLQITRDLVEETQLCRGSNKIDAFDPEPKILGHLDLSDARVVPDPDPDLGPVRTSGACG